MRGDRVNDRLRQLQENQVQSTLLRTPNRPLVLVCDDEPLVRIVVATELREAGFDTTEAADGDACIAMVEAHSPDCVVLDLVMPNRDGLSALKALRDAGNALPVVVLTGTGRVESAIAATKLGAAAYLQKPLEANEIGLAVARALADHRLAQQGDTASDAAHAEEMGVGDFIGRCDALAPLFASLERLARVAAPTILILGDSGTGKDVIARMIHERGPRRSQLFVEVDCTALPEHLVESELFGHERGAFTDARTRKLGLFEVAADGTVFLDEIGELTKPTQAKLLRALENRTFKRVGGVETLRLEAGVIAATNRDLRKEVAMGVFREDLFHRLNVVRLDIPPLVERRDDVPLLARYFLERFNEAFRPDDPVLGIERAAMAQLLAYPWPGNVRELKNLMEQLVILGGSGPISLTDLPPEIRFRTEVPTDPDLDGCPFELPPRGITLEQVERGFVVQALRRTNGNRTAAAALLGISRFQLRNRIERFQLG